MPGGEEGDGLFRAGGHLEWFHTRIRVEDRFVDGTPDPVGTAVRPGEMGAPGHGLVLRRADAE